MGPAFKHTVKHRPMAPVSSAWILTSFQADDVLQRAVRDARSQAKAQAEEEAAVRLEEAVRVALQQAERNRQA